jgi:hypothetical protein
VSESEQGAMTDDDCLGQYDSIELPISLMASALSCFGACRLLSSIIRVKTKSFRTELIAWVCGYVWRIVAATVVNEMLDMVVVVVVDNSDGNNTRKPSSMKHHFRHYY